MCYVYRDAEINMQRLICEDEASLTCEEMCGCSITSHIYMKCVAMEGQEGYPISGQGSSDTDTIRYYLQHLDTIYNTQILSTTLRYYLQHSDTIYNIQILSTTLRYYQILSTILRYYQTLYTTLTFPNSNLSFIKYEYEYGLSHLFS